MKEIEDVEEEAGVDWMREREGHLVGGGKGGKYNLRRGEPTSAPFPFANATVT